MQSGSCKIRMRNSGILTEIKHIHTYKPYSLAFARSMRFQGTRTTYLHIQVHMYVRACKPLQLRPVYCCCVPTCVYYDYFLRQICQIRQNDKIFFPVTPQCIYLFVIQFFSVFVFCLLLSPFCREFCHSCALFENA